MRWGAQAFSFAFDIVVLPKRSSKAVVKALHSNSEGRGSITLIVHTRGSRSMAKNSKPWRNLSPIANAIEGERELKKRTD